MLGVYRPFAMPTLSLTHVQSMGITDNSTINETDTPEVESDNDHSADETLHHSHWFPEFPFSVSPLFRSSIQHGHIIIAEVGAAIQNQTSMAWKKKISPHDVT
jgi:hypothetical protein